MIQRIIKLEKQMEQHSARLDENFARFADTKNDLEASTRSITNIQNEVQTSIKIATEAKECADTQKNDVSDLKSQIESGKMPTFAKVAVESRSDARNDACVAGSGSDNVDTDEGSADDRPWRIAGESRFNGRNVTSVGRPSSSTAGGIARDTTQRSHTDRRQGAYTNLHNRNAHRRSPYRYGSTRDEGQGRGLGAPLPSRYVVLERVMNDRTKQDIQDYMDRKNEVLKTNIPVRSIKLMTKPEAYYKKYLVEFSLEHFDIVRKEEFWPERVRVRIFKGNGHTWRDTETETVPLEGERESTPREVNEEV